MFWIAKANLVLYWATKYLWSSWLLWEKNYNPWTCDPHEKIKAHERILRIQKVLCNLSMTLYETKVSKEFIMGKFILFIDLSGKKFPRSFSLCKVDLYCIWSTLKGCCLYPRYQWSCMYHVPPHLSLSICLLRQGLTSSLEEKHISREVSIRKNNYDLYCDLSVVTSKKGFR